MVVLSDSVLAAVLLDLAVLGMTVAKATMVALKAVGLVTMV
jgi:hypothetical protein